VDVKVVPDDRKGAERGPPEDALELGVSPEDKSEDRGGDHQEGKQREKAVVGHDRGQIAPVILGVLQLDSERKAENAPPPLKAVERSRQIAESHPCSLWPRLPSPIGRSAERLHSLRNCSALPRMLLERERGTVG
jgi:hypothetical protein